MSEANRIGLDQACAASQESPLGGAQHIIYGNSGGVAANIDYEMVIAIGQHDAGVVFSNVVYRFSAGVLARVPSDVLFKDEFDGD
ncbi:MAG: hypothetical protein SGI99_07890 [Pseudomonadota bacterium]|nr:hypothetical protein [Pseudomonadota bacterium]